MTMSRLILKKLTQTHMMSPLPCSSQLIYRFSSATDHHEKPDTKEVTISDSLKKSELSSPRKRNRNRSLWWKNNYENFPFHPLSGIGNAVVEAAANMNRLVEKLSPTHLIRKFKEKDEMYSIKYQMPGLTKDDVKITVEDGVLCIRGQHREEEEGKGSDDDEFWSVASYGYYNTSLMLPEDAKVEDIKAEMKDGMLHVVIPKDKTKKKHIKEVHVD
uniref:26.5 kDa heat shock protein, mitochondrial n=1 Tax=Erigeron canadensis TaxID=72917 RepID=UPI001CB8922B|nr:26.5 kDa heat shock protein, mitochondrial [Erigeron canadensis]